jgi:sodium transport system permease protein
MFNQLFWRYVMRVFSKESKDAFRDKRTMRLAFLPAFYFVGMFCAGVLFAVNIQSDNEVNGLRTVSIPVSGAQHMPELINWLTEQGAQIKTIDGDAYQQVENRSLDYALIIPESAAQESAQLKSAEVWLVYDASNPKVHSAIGFVRAQIYAWSSRSGSLQLIARGISPELRNTIALRESNVASEQKMGVYILGSLPMLLLLSVFIGSVGFSADMTAGERERRSLESLLITPAPSLAIMLGKWLTSVLLTLAVLIVTMVMLGLSLMLLPFDQLGLRVDVGLVDMVYVFICLLPIIALAVGLQLFVALFARSFKDAQTYVGLLLVVPMAPILYNMFNPGVYYDWFLWVPVLGQQVMIKELFLGGELDGLTLLKFWLAGWVPAIIFINLAAKQLRRAKIIYGN